MMFVNPDNQSAENSPYQLSASGSIAHLGYVPESDVVQFRDDCGVVGGRGELMVKSSEGTLLQRIAIDRPGILVGRANGCDIRLQHPDVRYRHAYLQCVDDRILLCDLGKRVRGRRTQRNVVSELTKHNDVVSVGPYSIHLSLNNDIERSNPAPPTVDQTDSSRHFTCEHQPLTIQLELFAGAAKPTTFDVRHDLTLIGKGRACKVRLIHRSVSKVHCSLVRTRSGLWVVDLLGRGAGTLVDGRRVRFAQLHNDSVLQVGKFSARISITESEPSTTTPSNAPPLSAVQFAEPHLQVSDNATSDPTTIGHNGTSSLTHYAPTQLQTSQQSQNLAHPHNNGQANHVESQSDHRLIEIVRSMLAEFGATQTDVVERMHDSTIEMLQVITALQSNQIDSLREELQRVHEINAELLGLQKKSWQAMESAMQQQSAIEHTAPAKDVAALLKTGRELSQRMESLPSQIAAAVAATAPKEQTITVNHPERITQAEPTAKVSNTNTSNSKPLESTPDKALHEATPKTNTKVDEESVPPSAEQVAAKSDLEESNNSAKRVPNNPTSQAKVELGHAWVCGRIATLQKERDSRWEKIKRVFGGD
ncbi:FHA domain-containing protein [Symmachiella macrocystis]|nr:FHA domain-containing protein [Symmachiella macrocystis]